jgi:signal transduction histidine kinase/CheY-like chemotaxis protein
VEVRDASSAGAVTPRPDREVEAAQVAAAHGHIPTAVAVSVINALLLAVVLAGGLPGRELAVWLAVVGAVAVLRLALWWAQLYDRTMPNAPARWAWCITVGAGLAGCAWGGGAALLWPASGTEQLFWVFVVGGMSAGAAALHYALLPAVIAFILPAALPIAARYALDGSRQGLAAAAMILVFLAALSGVARRSNAQFSVFARMRRDLRRQARELEAARAELRQEVAEHRATAASLHQAQKMEALGQLTGGIAHDFNNLLMAVLGSLSLLRKRLPEGDARAARLLENAMAGANRGAALTQRLLAFGRRQALRPEVVALPALLEGMADLLRRSIGPAHALVIRVPPGLPPVTVDPGQLELAVLNLAINARDAMPAGGEIAIAAREERVAPGADRLAPGAHVVVGVADRGSGMDAATLARATEPFFTTKGIGKGTGLGLSMVYGLAAQSGGRLVLHSQPGEGTVAEIWLPCAEAAPAPAGPAAPPPAAPAPRRLHVLVVDDDPLVLASTAGMLEELGHAVDAASCGPDALRLLAGGTRVDLVLTDYGMPGMNGAELVAELGRLRPGLPVILATGYADVPAAPPRGVATLRKPFTQEALAAALARASAAAPGLGG